PRLAGAQEVHTVGERAESLRAAGRPWHAAESLLAAAARESRPNASFVVEGAKAELRARRYDRAKSLLAGQPWLDDYGEGEALAVRLLADVPWPAARAVPGARAQALIAAGDTALALDALAQAGKSLDEARLALAAGDTARARAALYDLMARAPDSDEAAAAVGVALAALPAATPSELVASARAMKGHGGASDARGFVERAVRLGGWSAATLLLLGELQAGAGRYRDAERAYRAAAKDSLVGPLAIYRRARVLVRLGDPGADEALAAFAQTYPADTAAPTALYLIGDMRGERGDAAGAARWFGELIARYPVDPRASIARFRLA